MKKKKSILTKISTKPSPNALKWAGQQVSVLSNILLWTLWACRVLSLLQIAKLIYRKIITVLHIGSTDKGATRPNVPPMFCEIYFILWAILFGCGYFFRINGLWITVLANYYLFESFVWLLYYTVFRRFYEENYSIYHEMEYFSVVILLVPTQAFAFTYIYDMKFSKILIALLGDGGDDAPISIKILGTLFAAIVIGMIITAFPSERVKKVKEKYRITVIGNGDVVKQRIYPALLECGASADNIEIFDLGEQKSSDGVCSCLPTEEDIKREVCVTATPKSVIFIATPTHAHVGYLRSFMDSKAGLIVVEKPISSKYDELEYVETLLSDGDTRDRLFFLSYYVLEKALPLTYLVSNNQAYLKYLDIDDVQSLHNWRLRLGALKSVNVDIREGQDNRLWTYEDENGGQLFETFLHTVLVASLLCGEPSKWENVSLNKSPDKSKISMKANSHRTEIHLNMEKNVKQKDQKRFAEFVFAHGSIVLNFDDRRADVYFEDLDKTTVIGVKARFTAKYQVQMDMVRSVAMGEYRSDEIDGIRNQIETLKWLCKLNFDSK